MDSSSSPKDATDPTVTYQSGVEALQQGRVDEAVEQLGIFVQLNPASFEGNHFLGIALAQKGEYDQAVPCLLAALAQRPDSPQTLYNLGLAYGATGDQDAARKQFELALTHDPQYQAARDALAGLGRAATREPVAAAPTPPAFQDYFRALVFGGLAAIIGAVLWDKFVYYTNIQFGLVAVAVGWLVGLGVAMGAGGKPARGLQVIGAVLAGGGMLLGHALIVNDYWTAMMIKEGKPPGLFLFRLLAGLAMTPRIIASDPLTLVFIAFGVWEGWKIPGQPTSNS